MHSAVHNRQVILSGRRLSRVGTRRRIHRQIRCSGSSTLQIDLRTLICLIGREAVKTNKAPAPIGAYSQAIKVEKLIFVGGQLGLEPGVI